MNKSDLTALEHIENVAIVSNDAIEQKILRISTTLAGMYSFADHQTYPRPNHPNPEKRKSTYFTLVAILISLRTTLENESKVMDAFMDRYRGPEDVLKSTEAELSEIVHMAGMPQKRAQTIMKATRYYLGELLEWGLERLKKLPLEQAREELMKIPGFWPKAADCLLELGLDLPSMVIDVNMLRVVSRMFGLPWAESPDIGNSKQIADTKAFIEQHLTKDAFLYQIVHTLLLVHGKYTCQSKPDCKNCRLRRECSLGAEKEADGQMRLVEI